MTKRLITLIEVKRRIKGLDPEQQKATVCALVGHSLIRTGCFGYWYCARCAAQVGDSLACVNANGPEQVVVGHNCEMCRANYAKLDWRHTFMTPDPFAEQQEPTP